MRPGTMRSTSVEQKVQSPFTQRAKPSFQPPLLYVLVHTAQQPLPLLSMSSQESTTTPGLPCSSGAAEPVSALRERKRADSPQGGTRGSYTMPASVVLETMYSSASPAATSIMAS